MNSQGTWKVYEKVVADKNSWKFQKSIECSWVSIPDGENGISMKIIIGPKCLPLEWYCFWSSYSFFLPRFFCCQWNFRDSEFSIWRGYEGIFPLFPWQKLLKDGLLLLIRLRSPDLWIVVFSRELFICCSPWAPPGGINARSYLKKKKKSGNPYHGTPKLGEIRFECLSK